MTATKFQVTMPIDFAEELKLAAQKLGIPLAEWIRATMQTELKRQRERESKPATHWLCEMEIDDDPDVSSRIDQILYGE